MNKIVELKKWQKIYKCLGYKSYELISATLLYEFGMEEYTPLIMWRLKVIDESKFALFMLKYPEYIENISYE